MSAPGTLPLLRSRRRLLFRVALASAAFLGWVLTLSALQSYVDFRDLLRAEDRWFTEDLFFVSRDVKVSDTMRLTQNKVDQQDLEALRNLEGVRLAEPVLRNDFPVSIEIGGGLIPTLTSEMFLESVPDQVLQRRPTDWNWDQDSGGERVPIIIPRDFLNLYNFGFAPGKGMPPVSEAAAQKIRFRVLLYPQNGGRATQVQGRIAGFSDQIQSILVPQAFLEWANNSFAGATTQVARRLVVAGQQVDASRLNEVLSTRGLRASGGSATTARLRILLDAALLVAAAAGLVILGLNLLLQWTESESILHQNESRIQRLFLLGHRPETIALRLIVRQLCMLSGTVLAALCLLWWLRASVVSSLQQAGLPVADGLHPLTFFASGGLFLFLCAWLNLKISLRLKRLYLNAR